MEVEYVTRDGDVLDAVVYAAYGQTGGGVVEAVLLANPSLVDAPAILPAGVRITLPDIALPDTDTTAITLW